MGGRGAASSNQKWNWQDDYKLGGDNVQMINKDPIGPENKPMYKDSVKNITSVYPILQVNDIKPVTVKGAAGVAVIGVEARNLDDPNKVEINGYINLGFDDEVFATAASLNDVVTHNHNVNWLSTGEDNHIVIHEAAHMLDYQLSIKKNANISLEEFLAPKEIDRKNLAKEQGKMMDYLSKHKRFSAGFADDLQKEMNQTPEQVLNQVSNYARRNEAEFFAESFTQWYLSSNKDGDFEKAFEKVLKDRIKKIS